MNRFDAFSTGDTLPNRAARRWVSVSTRRAARKQRKGQALVLAVLIMLMIALVSAGFLVVVSGNMNQTARISDKSRAVEAARSGLRFVNEQLTYSRLGEHWRPGFKTTGVVATDNRLRAEGETLMPQAGDASFNLVYTSVDRANGWAGTFAKFPDPLAPRNDAPTFLARVQRVPGELDAGDADATDPTKQGALKITVIGLSPDDPAAFHKTIAYKGGQNAPVGRFMRTVSNWDFKNKVVPSATANYDNITQVLTISGAKGAFPTVPFSVLIGDAGSPDLASAVVDSVPAAGQLHIASEPFGKKLSNVRVELAAQLGAPLPMGVAGSDSAIDFNLDGTIAADKSENAALSVSQPTSAGNARVNGGLAFTGAVSLPDLDASTGETVRVSGLMIQSAPTADSKATISLSGAPTTPIDLASGSNAADFPGAGVSTDLVSDGADRLQLNAGGNRDVAPFTPPDFSSGAGATRYRALTRESNSLVAGQPDAATFGFGEGVYINNPSDRERVFAGGKLRDMTQAELVAMWLSRKSDGSDDTGLRFNRAATPATSVALDASLEEQHLRGWVAPDEFHARGALVELFNDASDGNKAKIAVTLDARSDNSGAGPNNALGPVEAKAWRDASGAVQTGVYRRVFAWPANGVLFAEGNVRVRGEATNAPRSLTVVSQNNIYIDGSVGAGTRKVLLLARKNVVANPTAAIFRPDVQTLAQSAVTLSAGTSASIPVADAGDFRAGDIIETVAPTAPTAVSTVALVQSLSGNTLSVLPLAPGSVTSGDVVRSRPDSVVGSRSVVASPIDSIQRRVQVSDATNLRLTFDHSADKIQVLTVGTEVVGGANHSTDPILWTNKRSADASGNIVASEKFARGQFTSPTTGTDSFPATPPSDNPSANANTVSAIVAALNGAPPHVDAGAGIGWKYTATANAPYSGVPFHYLAAIRNRQTFAAPATPATARSVDIKNAPYEMTLATSVAPLWNGAPIALSGFDAAPDAAHTSRTFGFSPDFLGGAEDGLTGDESFYQGDARKTTLDSRSVPGATTGISALCLSQTPGLVGISPGAPLPQYRMGRLKMERLDGTTQEVAPGYTMNIQAFVYAQTGSWFVIPNAPFDASAFQDASGNSLFATGGAKDLNRNGTADAGETGAFLRYARANYRLSFVGAIAENQTALVNPAGAIPGAVQAWSNEWASYNQNGGAISDPVAGVSYSFDPSYANGALFGDEGFVVPQSSELTYVE